MTGPLFISFQPTARPYVERLHAYLAERAVPAWFDDAAQPALLVDRAILDRIEQSRGLVAVGDVTADPQSRTAHEVAYARRVGKPVHEIPASTVASGWLPGDDFIAAVGGAIAAGAMPSDSMYGDVADLVLDRAGDQTVAVIKTLRELTGISLAAARVVVEGAPTVVLRNVRRHLAESVVQRLAIEGATVRVVPAGAEQKAQVVAGTVHADELRAVMAKHFDLVLDHPGDKKLKVIMTVRQLTGLGLKETKDLVEAAPQVVLSGQPWARVQQGAVELRQADAQVTVR